MASLKTRRKTRRTIKGYICEWVPEVARLPGEIWKRVLENDDAFVSNMGRFQKGGGPVIVPGIDGAARPTIKVGRKQIRFEWAVLETFGIPQLTSKHVYPGHRDKTKIHDNRLANLVWETKKEDRKKQRSTALKKRSKPVRARGVNDGFNDWRRFPSGLAADLALGVDHGNISLCCRIGGGWAQRGDGPRYYFEFDEPHEEPQLEGEIWATFRGRTAEISNLGRFKDAIGIVKTPAPTGSNYAFIGIETERYLLHEVVAELFLERSPGKSAVRHLDGNRSNNRVSNLAWEYDSVMAQERTSANKRKKMILRPSLSCRRVRLRLEDSNDDDWIYYNSAKEAATLKGLHQHVLQSTCNQNAKIENERKRAKTSEERDE